MWKNMTLLCLSAAVAGSLSAAAEAKPRLQNVSITIASEGYSGPPTQIEVTGTDGQYTSILGSQVHFPVRVKGRVRGGKPRFDRIKDAYLFVRGPSGTRASGTGNDTFKYNLMPLNYRTRKFDLTHRVDLPVWKLGDHRQRIVQACNDLIAEQGPPQTNRTINYQVFIRAVLTAHIGNHGGFGYWDVKRSNDTSLTIPVICRRIVPPTATGTVGFDHGAMKVTGIQLFRSTYGYNHNANAGTKCQKLKVLVRLKTNGPGYVKFRLWKKVGNGAMQDNLHFPTAAHDGNGGYKAEYTEVITVNEPTYVQLKAEELVNTVGHSTPWKSINLKCTSSGGGGFTVGAPQQDPLPPQPPLKIVPQLSLNDLSGKKRCAREGTAVIAFKTNRPDPIPYKFACSFGTVVNGVAQTAPHSKGGWIAPAVAKFTIDKTKTYHCRLYALDKETDETIVATVAERDFSCANRVVDPHPGGLTDGKPTGHLSVSGTKITNPQKCLTTWKKTCNRVPERKCSKTVKTTCTQVPKTSCRNVRTRTCKMVPKVQCRMQVTRSCKRVPKVNCRMVRGKRVCQRTMTTQCRPQRKRVCSRSMQRKCTMGTKRECRRTMTRKCTRTPTTTCKQVWRNECRRQKVRSCN